MKPSVELVHGAAWFEPFQLPPPEPSSDEDPVSNKARIKDRPHEIVTAIFTLAPKGHGDAKQVIVSRELPEKMELAKALRFLANEAAEKLQG